MSLRQNLVEYPPTGLVVAIQFYEGDMTAALRLARLLADLEPRRRDDVILAFARRFDCPVTQELTDTFMHCARKFAAMHLPSKREGVGHPDGCNALWSSTMEQLSERWQAGRLGACSVFTIEHDGIPMSADWLDRLRAEHERSMRAGKRVTGCLTEFPMPHINGTMIAHLSMWPDRPSLHRTPSLQAWDTFHAMVLTSEAQPTTLIKNVYGAREWSEPVLNAMAKETAWLSSTKCSSAIEWAERALVPRATIPLAETSETRH